MEIKSKQAIGKGEDGKNGRFAKLETSTDENIDQHNHT
jgi:hypothetical protein